LVGEIIARTIAAAALVWIVSSLLGDRWRGIEAAAAVTVLRVLGVESVTRVGDQIFALGGEGHTFTANIGQWCSSMAIVATFAAFAGVVSRASRQRRWRAFRLGATVIIVGNLVRIVATVLVGVRFGPGSIEGFHDSIATWFAVVFVLGGFVLFVFSLANDHEHGRVAV
jgi:exosortase/archaeosortase family protein